MRPHPLLERYYDGETARVRRVRDWFDATAPSYDRITQGMSFGTGNWYRGRALERAGLAPGATMLDVACGTGLLAASARRIVGANGRVVALDPSAGMLGQARGRGLRSLVRGFAEALPFADGSFDFVSMGYALRHVADLEITFAEYRRVLRPGGRLLVLEITPPRSRLAFRLLRLYLGRIVPWLARRHGAAPGELMRYYWETIEQCVAPSAILAALAASGFDDTGRRVELGIFSEYAAVAG